METKSSVKKPLKKVVIRFAGDSGDGMQLTGSQFTFTSALFGNDLATFPDFPAEIRAPLGTVEGVSGFQVQIGGVDIFTPGDEVDVLVAMNPAALRVNFKQVRKGGNVIIDEDSFDARSIEKAGYLNNPMEDGSLSDYNVIGAPITTLTKTALKDMGLDNKTMLRSKNMFALGIMYWLFDRPMDQTLKFIEHKFKNKPDLIKANVCALNAGFFFAETVETLPSGYTVPPATYEKGIYRTVSGNIALSWGLIAAAEKCGKKLFCGSYPITPASDILHELAKHKQLGVITIQAEDEISAICMAIGASYAGSLAVTTSSGPGISLKGEAMGLAVMTELPLVVINVQRSGPSTGMPTKTSQTDLLQAMYGRNGESPMIVLAPSSPANCFNFAYTASKIALEHNTPVILLSDCYLANGSEPWKFPLIKDMPEINIPAPVLTDGSYLPYTRDPEKLSRYHAIPGTKGMEHRIGGLEKQDITGNISYDPENHGKMVALRTEKVNRIANYIPEQSIFGDKEGDFLVVGWGSTSGAIYTAVKELKQEGTDVSWTQFNYINPLPKNTGDVLSGFKNILVCELNLGQFVNLLRSKYPGNNYQQFNKVEGQPFKVSEIKNAIKKHKFKLISESH